MNDQISNYDIHNIKGQNFNKYDNSSVFYKYAYLM